MRAVLCDVDGTLVDTTYIHTVCWWQAFVEAGHRVPSDEIRAAIGMGADQLVPHMLGRDPDAQEIRDLSHRHDELARPYCSLFQPTAGAAEFLRGCAGRGVRVVLASSAKQEELAALRRAVDADDAIAAATSADQVETSKPAPDLVHQALDRAGVTPADAVFVGDSSWDIEAAHRAGVRCIALTCGGTTAADLRKAGADAVYRDPADLLANLGDAPVALSL